MKLHHLNSVYYFRRGAHVTLFFLMFFCFATYLFSQEADLEKARQLAMSGQHQAAETELVQLVSNHPDFLPAKLLRAHNHSWWRQFELAQQEFNAILKEFPKHEEALIGLGYAYAWAGNTPNAFFPFRQVLRTNPKNEEARKGVGHTYLIAGNGEAAIYVFKKLTQEYPQNPEYYTGKGQAYILLGDAKNARKSLQKAIGLDPNNQIASELLSQNRTQNSIYEVDVWGGFSRIGDRNRGGLRLVQLSWKATPRFTVYGKYDNTLSLDNIDFVNRHVEATSAWVGGLAGWNQHLASRIDYGLRFFPNLKAQHMIKVEQVLYAPNAASFKIGGFLANASDTPIEWYANLGLLIPFNKVFSFETNYFYARNELGELAEHRWIWSGKVRHPKGHEITLGGFLGNPNFNTEFIQGANNQISGGYLVGLFPVSRSIWGQIAINLENGVFEKSTILAAGLKIRLEK